MPKSPEDPFGFKKITNKDNPDPKKLPPSLRGTNTPEDEQSAEDAVSAPQAKIVQLYKQARESLDTRDEVWSTKEGEDGLPVTVDSRKLYDQENPTTRHRKDLLLLVGSSPDFQAIYDADKNETDIPDTPPEKIRRMERLLSVALNFDIEEDVFSIDDQRDLSDEFYSEDMLEPSIESIDVLYGDARERLRKTVMKRLDPLGMIPTDIHVSEAGGIVSAMLSLDLALEELPPPVQKKLSGTTDLALVYQFEKDVDGEFVHHYFGLRGTTADRKATKEIELSDHGIF